MDLGGLTDRTIGRAPGYYYNKRPPPEYLLSRAPDAYLITSLAMPKAEGGEILVPPHYEPESYVMGQPWFAEQYSFVGVFKVNDAYFLTWFARKGAPGSDGAEKLGR
ncbi:MAG: hypothetical protein R3F14_20535 [Polyangiaceae bacterium]